MPLNSFASIVRYLNTHPSSSVLCVIQEGQKALDFTKGGEVEIPLSDGNVMSIPVEKITYKPETQTINISEEMAKTAVWRQLASNAERENIGTKKPKKR
jgi:hypothetical protein